MKKTIFFLFFTFAFLLSAFAQTLTVRDIMREPSLAGMRADSERLSPDGQKVIFAWNADGKEPRNLYLWENGATRFLVNAEANFEQRTQPPESKLNYGLIVRDEFVKAREKNLGGVDFSPDSKRILFSQNSDIYVLDLVEKIELTESVQKNIDSKWAFYESSMMRRVDLIPNLVEAVKIVGVKEEEFFGKLARSRNQLLNSINETTLKSEAQRLNIISLNNDFGKTIGGLLSIQENYPQLRTNEQFLKLKDELSGTENRLNVARLDYNDAIQYSRKLPNPRRITRTQGFENSARWLTNDSILYSSNGNYFVLNLKETSLVQVTKEANPTAFISIFNAAPTKDGQMLAYVVSDGSRQRALFVPNYLDEYVQSPAFRRGWTEQKIYVAPTDGSRETPFEIKLPRAEGVSYIRSVKWAADDKSLVVDRIDKDTKRRQLFYVYLVGSKAEKTILVTEETDEKWVAPLSRIIEPNPKDASQIIFASERDGYNHLYLATLERGKPQPNPTGEIRQEVPGDAGFSGKVETKQLTKGNFEIDFAKWREDRDEIVFSSTEKNTAERQFFIINSQTGQKSDVPSGEKGMKTNAQMISSQGGTYLLFQNSRWNQPNEIFIQRVCPECRGLNYERKITNSTPDSFKKTSWAEPKFIDIPSRDGKKIKSKIYLPPDFGDNTAKRIYPMVIFVHGAGYLQNTINGWNNYFREFMFNHILTQKGYVILDIDFRGSAGYGRDWRTDVHDFLGGKDYEDHLDAIDFMVKNYAVDAKRVGVYGGSYGGFMAGMLVMRAPDKIAAAAALRPVFDWKNYYASSNIYTTERLGFPDKNPEAYKRSSPIAYADKLQKPLLILHGLLDDNVHAQDSIQLVEKLLRLEKTQYFEAMFYPAENHGFTRPTSWADEYERILSFFEKHLK